MKDILLFLMWLLFMEWIKYVVENVIVVRLIYKNINMLYIFNNFVE